METSQILRAFFFGIRFDYTAIFYTNALIFIPYLFPFSFFETSRFKKVMRLVFILVNFSAILLNLGDASYFEFAGKRTTADFFAETGQGNEFFEMLGMYIYDYWYVLVFTILLTIILWYLFPIKKQVGSHHSVSLSLSGFFTVFFIMILAFGMLYGLARGFGLKPTRIITAANYVNANAIPLCLNSTFTVISTQGRQDLPQYSFFKEKELDLIFSPVVQFPHESEMVKKNVVIIILESFGREYIGALNLGKGFTPFLDSLIGQSLVFDRAFANGKKSIEGIPAIIAGIPALMESPYITSQFAANNIQSLAGLLSDEAYTCSFFHGGANGTMGFDQFCRIAGFHSYYGRNEYGTSDFDGNWGVYDEPYFQYFAKRQTQFSEPFFSCIFSLSSHHPYPIPVHLQGKFPKGTLPIHQSIAYTDFALRQYFKNVSREKWFRNTLFVITADHTSLAKGSYYANDLGKYAVPIIFFDPSNPDCKGINHKITQQIDILPSVMDYLNYGKDFFAFGRSVFANEEGFSIQYAAGIYQLNKAEFFLQSDLNGLNSMYNVKNDSLLKRSVYADFSDDNNKLLEFLRAYIQVFNQRMAGNQLVP